MIKTIHRRWSPALISSLALFAVCGSGTAAAAIFAYIHDIQGNGSAITGVGPFTVEAIVVGQFQSGEALRGFFIEEEDADADANPATSEGIFVYCGTCPTPVSVGDRVQVTGAASEYLEMSELTASSAESVVVLGSGNALPTPALITLPAAGSTRAAGTFENLEGMLVRFANTLYVSDYYDLSRYGQLVLTAEEEPRQFTDAFAPSVSAFNAYWDELNKNRIILDDDNNLQYDAITGSSDEPYFWPRPGLSNSNFLRGGDSISDLTGVMHWSPPSSGTSGAWRVRPVEPAFNYTFSNNNPRPAQPTDVGGSLKVASFDTFNYFTTINSLGADSAAELARQREKAAAAISAINADVVALLQIENNGTVAVSDLLNGANGVNATGGMYAFIDTGVIGNSLATVALIYRPARVTPIGAFDVLKSSVDSRFNDALNYPALAQTFQDNLTGGRFTMVTTVLKGKSPPCPADPNLGDGQSNCNLTRQNAAAALVDWLATDPTGSGSENFLIMGNLNSYRKEDPIRTIEWGADDTAATEDDFTDLIDTFVGPSAYSYVYDGQLGYLETALASRGLSSNVTGVSLWHINADEMGVFDYNDDIQDGSNESPVERESTSLPIYEPNGFRTSDHDPVIVGLNFCDEIAPKFDVLSATPPLLWPPNHKYRDVSIRAVVSDNLDQNPAVTLISVMSNEPDDAPGTTDGKTTNDIVVLDALHFQLRAERSDLGSGRIYTITYQVTDHCGNSATGSATVTVPLDWK